ncbi:hypothetical protein EYF80_058704 [Liparis tanakae]|uniref:Uncharacterized protein n=1 Tax=Liparis tanakae TaxID=230148 RepID=A0A4Z2ERZ9_9TELE|nr:hypothetical protein EYF80_058704 [Liparis tanakae]
MMISVKAHLGRRRGGDESRVDRGRTNLKMKLEAPDEGARVDRALGAMVEPCCMKPPTGNQKLLPSEYWLMSRLQRPLRHGWGLYHS